MEIGSSGSGPQSLQGLLVALKEADNSEQAFLDLILETAAGRDPELPDVVRAGAIPRSLNATIVGVLRGLPDEVQRNRDLLAQVATFGFVVPRPDGGLTYHDNIRDSLRADWRSTDQKRERFRELNVALATFYENRYAEHRTSDRRLREVSQVVARANPGRLRRLSDVIEADMGANLTEATYHRLSADPPDGFSFFQRAFFELETSSHVDICVSLVSSVRDFLQRLPPDDVQPSLLAWLDYFDVRVRQRRPDYDPHAAEIAFQRLRERADLPDDLRTWILDDLALINEGRLELDAALDARREGTERWLGVDPYNDPLRLNNLGNLFWWVGDYESARQHFHRAIRSADEVPGARPDFQVFARLDLSGLYIELGEWAPAFDIAAEAFDRARRSFQDDVTVQRAVATRFAQLLATFDGRASDCAAVESVAVAHGIADQQHIAVLNYIDILFQANRIPTAGAWVGRLAAQLDEAEDESLMRLELAFRRARLAELEDRPAAAEEAYSAVLIEIASGGGNDLLRLNSLRRRGASRTTLGDTAAAVIDLTAVRDEFARRGCLEDAAVTEVLLAEALLKAGDASAAQVRVDAARAALQPGMYRNRAMLVSVEGDVFRHLEDWASAERKYREALEMATTLRDFEYETELLRKLAAMYGEQAQTERATESERRAELVDQERAQADAFNLTAEERPVESENGRGMRSFGESGDRATALDRARQFFASAHDIEPDNLWPLLNLSVVYAELDDWQGASEALEHVLDLSPAPMRTPQLVTWLRDDVLEHAKGLLLGRDPAGAAAFSAAALERLASTLPPSRVLPVQVVNFVASAVAGGPAARDSCRAALAAGVAVGDESFVDGVVSLLDDVESYWAVDAMLHELQEEPNASPPATALAAKARAALVDSLDRILRLTGASTVEIPVVTPIVAEVGDALVPIVDSAQDGGVFLFELVPAMRDRIRSSTGVTVPGVRMRGNPSLAPERFTVQVDEVPVLTGSVEMGRRLAVVPFQPNGPRPAGELIDVHPLNGERGLWVLSTEPEGGDAPGLTNAQNLVYRIELAIRAHLARYLGPQELSILVDTWAEDDPEDLVAAVLPDADARLRLTWVLQALVDDGVPVSDWAALLAAIREAGGVGRPVAELRRAVRARLRSSLPGPQTGRTVVIVPAEHEEALLKPTDANTAIDPEHDVMRWLRGTVAAMGPAITLVTRTQNGREQLSALARTEDRLITTMSQDELSTP